MNVAQGRSNWNAKLHFKRSKVKDTGCQKTKKMTHVSFGLPALPACVIRNHYDARQCKSELSVEIKNNAVCA